MDACKGVVEREREYKYMDGWRKRADEEDMLLRCSAAHLLITTSLFLQSSSSLMPRMARASLQAPHIVSHMMLDHSGAVCMCAIVGESPGDNTYLGVGSLACAGWRKEILGVSFADCS